MTPPKKLSPSPPQPRVTERQQRGRVDRSAMFPVAAPAGDMPADYGAWLAEIKRRIHGEDRHLVCCQDRPARLVTQRPRSAD